MRQRPRAESPRPSVVPADPRQPNRSDTILRPMASRGPRPQRRAVRTVRGARDATEGRRIR